MLTEGQDPESLASRLAYHLHRTHNRTTALTRAGITQDKQFASDLVQGRVAVTKRDIEFVARQLDISFSELVRPLTPEEDAEWTFYRVSGRNRLAVWERARALWLRNGLTDALAAQTMGVPKSKLSRALHETSKAVLSLDQAKKLAMTIGSADLLAKLVEGLEEIRPR